MNSIRTARIVALIPLVPLGLGTLGGCRAMPEAPGSMFESSYSAFSEPSSAKVSSLVREAKVARRAGDLDRARTLLREAVKLDSTGGTARHELGVVYHVMGDSYNAAVELDAASRLLRDRVEPCHNLGLVLEAGGMYELAIRAYERGLRRNADHLPTLENLARVRIKSGLDDRETLKLLTRCIERETRPDWSDWLNRQAVRLRKRLGSARPSARSTGQSGEVTTDPDPPAAADTAEPTSAPPDPRRGLSSDLPHEVPGEATSAPAGPSPSKPCGGALE